MMFAAIGFFMACTLAFVPQPAFAQAVDAPTPDAKTAQSQSPVKERFLTDHFPEQPSAPPKWTISIDSLGFSAPGAIYLGARNALVSLDFLDEDRLLLTFRVPGLLHRDTANGTDSDEREIRAVVLVLPQGTVETQTTWTVHDRVRYLWMLHDGHFLLRDRNTLFEGDSSLVLKPFLDFPGSLLWIELDPTKQFLVTNSREPAAAAAKSGISADGSTLAQSNPDQSTNPSMAAADDGSDQDTETADNSVPPLVVRILRRKSGQVILVSRTRTAVHLPINSEGYVENLRGRETEWLLNLGYFTGGTRLLGRVDSTCEPQDDFLSDQMILVTACGSEGESKLIAMTTGGRTLWISGAPATQVWPHLSVAANGSRFAWTTLDTTHAVNSYAPMGTDDIKEQSVTVFDTANGNIPLVSPLSPMFDAGGNVAISPSGRRVALINNGAVQVFDLPPPPPLPVTAETHPAR
jgi:hypothetical protein